MDDEIAKWRAERRANYPSAKKDKTESSEPEKVRNTKRRNDKHELNLHDKMFLTDVHKEEERIIQCLKLLVEEDAKI